jgi:hypothetical protein
MLYAKFIFWRQFFYHYFCFNSCHFSVATSAWKFLFFLYPFALFLYCIDVQECVSSEWKDGQRKSSRPIFIFYRFNDVRASDHDAARCSDLITDSRCLLTMFSIHSFLSPHVSLLLRCFSVYKLVSYTGTAKVGGCTPSQ